MDAFDRDDGKEGGGKADEDVGPQSCHLVARLAFEADQSAEENRSAEAGDDGRTGYLRRGKDVGENLAHAT